MWLSKKQTKSSNGGGAVSDKLAEKIAGSIMKIQTSFGNGLNKLFKKMSIKKIKLILISFCLLIGGYSIFLIVAGLTKGDQNQNSFISSKPRLSSYFKRSHVQIVEPAKYINEKTFRRIEEFKQYLDSLKQQKSYQYDSIIKARPFLMDSILILEEIYQSQNQK